MKKMILIPLLFTLLHADLPMPNSKYIRHDVTLTNAEAFKDMAVVYCRMSMERVISCKMLKNNTLLSKYKFEPTPYLFAMKKHTYEKYNKLGFFTKSSYQKALYALIKNLKSPIGVSWSQYIPNDNVTSETKDTHSYFKITNIKNGYMHFELLKETK